MTRQVYLYQVADNETCMAKYGVQAVVWQTGINPVIAMELLATGAWQGKGVLEPSSIPTRSWRRWRSTISRMDQGDVIMFGFTGKILHVNLTTGQIGIRQAWEKFCAWAAA